MKNKDTPPIFFSIKTATPSKFKRNSNETPSSNLVQFQKYSPQKLVKMSTAQTINQSNQFIHLNQCNHFNHFS